MGRKTMDGIYKRPFQRLNIKLDVKVTFGINEKKQVLMLKSSNLSQQGICLEASQEQAETLNIISNTNNFESIPFDMEIVLPPEHTCINIQGKACWYDIAREKEHFHYRIGVVFIDPGQKEHKFLKNFLKNAVKTKVF